MKLGNVIIMLRSIGGFSQKDLAKRLNLSPSCISLIENNHRRPDWNTLNLLSKEFKIPIWVIFYLASTKKEKTKLINSEVAKWIIK